MYESFHYHSGCTSPFTITVDVRVLPLSQWMYESFHRRYNNYSTILTDKVGIFLRILFLSNSSYHICNRYHKFCFTSNSCSETNNTKIYIVYKNVILIYKFSLVIHTYYSISLKCQVFQIDGILFFNGVSILFFLWCKHFSHLIFILVFNIIYSPCKMSKCCFLIENSVH